MTTITLTATQLRDLVTPVIPHASKRDDLPVLNAVRIRTSGRYVTAIATDRYRLAFKRVPLDPEPAAGFDAVVSVDVLKRVLVVFKAGRSHNPALTLTVEDGRLTVAVADTIEAAMGALPLVAASMSFHTVDGDYPTVDELLATALKATPQPEVYEPGFNPEFLASFRIGQDGHQPMRLAPSGHVTKPWIVRIGDDFIGLIVPFRFASGPQPVKDDESWLAMLDAPSEEPKAA